MALQQVAGGTRSHPPATLRSHRDSLSKRALPICKILSETMALVFLRAAAAISSVCECEPSGESGDLIVRDKTGNRRIGDLTEGEGHRPEPERLKPHPTTREEWNTYAAAAARMVVQGRSAGRRRSFTVDIIGESQVSKSCSPDWRGRPDAPR